MNIDEFIPPTDVELLLGQFIYGSKESAPEWVDLYRLSIVYYSDFLLTPWCEDERNFDEYR